MKSKNLFSIISIIILTCIVCNNTFAQDKNLVMRIANLQIDSAQLENYKVALKEEIETSVRVEVGVLSLYAVYDKAHPTHVTVFETYANVEAYKAHLETPHFKKYKTITKKMVKSLELIDTVPIALEVKAKRQ
jgi:quinol monooxygenase YgiN